MAQVCLGLGKSAVAESIHSGLLVEVEEKDLADWDPELVAEALTEYQACLRTLAQSGRDVTEQVTAVARLLCRVDALAALKTVT